MDIVLCIWSRYGGNTGTTRSCICPTIHSYLWQARTLLHIVFAYNADGVSVSTGQDWTHHWSKVCLTEQFGGVRSAEDLFVFQDSVPSKFKVFCIWRQGFDLYLRSHLYLWQTRSVWSELKLCICISVPVCHTSRSRFVSNVFRVLISKKNTNKKRHIF